MIILDCGHECKIRPFGFPFMLKTEECDAVDGFVKAVSYHSWCRDCFVDALMRYPDQMMFEEYEADEYFKEQE